MFWAINFHRLCNILSLLDFQLTLALREVHVLFSHSIPIKQIGVNFFNILNTLAVSVWVGEIMNLFRFLLCGRPTHSGKTLMILAYLLSYNGIITKNKLSNAMNKWTALFYQNSTFNKVILVVSPNIFIYTKYVEL